MDVFIQKLKLILEDKGLRKRLFFVIAMFAVFRALAVIPIPGVNVDELARTLAGNQFLGLLNIFSGGGLSNLSIVMLGVGPYITASIIMQLMTMVFPRFKEMYQEEGDIGRKKFSQYSRLLSIPLALLQAYGLMAYLQTVGVLEIMTSSEKLVALVVITAGSALLMWIGELINEYGIGNGVSLIIFAGIVASIPSALGQVIFAFTADQAPVLIAFIAIAIAIIAGVVIVTEAERPIPVTYAKRVRGNKVYGGMATYLPLRLNQAGVIPILFALSILMFPQMIASFLATVANPIVQSAVSWINYLLANQWLYGAMYFVLVFVFTYFYTAVTFDPNQLSENLQKNGAFIPGVRPGQSTASHISRILTRLTAFGALFLAIIAILPLVMKGITGIQALAIGGTGLLIVVSVVLDLIKQMNAQVSMREY